MNRPAVTFFAFLWEMTRLPHVNQEFIKPEKISKVTVEVVRT